MSEALFDMEPVARPTPGGTELSADQRRTLRQRQRLERGVHPIAHRGLHPEAPRVTDPNQAGDGPRCGSCARLEASPYHNRRYLKCALVGTTNGAGTDMRRWWPACTAWEAKP